MSIINEFNDVILEELNFKMKTLPIPDENNALKMGIGVDINHLTKVDDTYLVNCRYFLSIGNDLTEEKRLNLKHKDFKDRNNYLTVDYKMSFKVIDESLLLDENEELSISNKLNTEIKAISEPYFKEIVNNIFSRSEFPTPPIPFKFWGNIDEIM